jgi:predicted cation transporter
MTILILVLILPFILKVVEENLEYFFFGMGLLGVILNIIYGLFKNSYILKLLFKKAALAPVMISGHPIGITQVVFIFGLIFLYFHKPIYKGIDRVLEKVGLSLFTFFIITLLGLIASIISVIVTAVILAEIVYALPLDRRGKLEFTVYSAFSVGLGAALTPVGEPLSTIAISKLGAPFFYLVDILGPYIIPGIIAVAAFTAYRMRRYAKAVKEFSMKEAVYTESLRNVIERTFRVYIFVAALELLGASLTPITVWYFTRLPAHVLYWVNTISAVVDNATLTAAEISPTMTVAQIRSALLGLLISGGMLIPGNIPNIVAAGRLKITMREWARLGVPFGLALLIIYFVVLYV